MGALPFCKMCIRDRNQLEQGGFACAGVTQQKDELAFIHMEVDILQRKAALSLIHI